MISKKFESDSEEEPRESSQDPRKARVFNDCSINPNSAHYIDSLFVSEETKGNRSTIIHPCHLSLSNVRALWRLFTGFDFDLTFAFHPSLKEATPRVQVLVALDAVKKRIADILAATGVDFKGYMCGVLAYLTHRMIEVFPLWKRQLPFGSPTSMDDLNMAIHLLATMLMGQVSDTVLDGGARTAAATSILLSSIIETMLSNPRHLEPIPRHAWSDSSPYFVFEKSFEFKHMELASMVKEEKYSSVQLNANECAILNQLSIEIQQEAKLQKDLSATDIAKSVIRWMLEEENYDDAFRMIAYPALFEKKKAPGIVKDFKLAVGKNRDAPQRALVAMQVVFKAHPLKANHSKLSTWLENSFTELFEGSKEDKRSLGFLHNVASLRSLARPPNSYSPLHMFAFPFFVLFVVDTETFNEELQLLDAVFSSDGNRPKYSHGSKYKGHTKFFDKWMDGEYLGDKPKYTTLPDLVRGPATHFPVSQANIKCTSAHASHCRMSTYCNGRTQFFSQSHWRVSTPSNGTTKTTSPALEAAPTASVPGGSHSRVSTSCNGLLILHVHCLLFMPCHRLSFLMNTT